MEGKIVFLLVCSIFSGIIFAIGCVASVIKAVRDRRQILRRRNERNQIGMRDTDSADNQSDDGQKNSPVAIGISDNNIHEPEMKTRVSAKSLRSSNSFQSSTSEKIEMATCMKGTFDKNSPEYHPGNAIQLSVIDRKYAIHSKAENGYVNCRMDHSVFENGNNPSSVSIGNPWKRGENSIVHQNRHSTSGTLLMKSQPTFLRTKSYQSAMKTNIYAEVPSPSKSDFEFSSSENILNFYSSNERRPGCENNAYYDEDSQLRYL
ncbi:uncharacterized protein LOC115217445 [Argonauta hians]